LSSLALAAARAALLGAAEPLATIERLSVEEALGRITAAPVPARSSVPHYLGAAMDGVALRATDAAAASEQHPVDFEEGDPATARRPFVYVDTGHALPGWADAVVMIERVLAGAARDAAASEVRGAAAGRPPRVHLRAAVSPWQHVRLVGEDVVASDFLVPRGHRLRPADVGALLAAGVLEVPVRPRPVVAILPTGDELIEPGEELRPGRIVEFNSRMIAAFVREWGGAPLRLAPSRDERATLHARLEEARARADVVCVIAGSSAGRRDFTVDALAALGRILSRGVAVVPGRPTILAAFEPAAGGRARVALGIPGYPVSAWVACRELLEPLLARLLGTAPLGRERVAARVVRDLASKPGNEELIRVNLGRVGDRMIAAPLGRGAGALTTVVRADGLIRVPPGLASIAAGTEVEVELLRPLAEAQRTILVAAARDPALSILEDVLRSTAPPLVLATTGSGATSGPAALRRGEAHVALVARPCPARDAAPPESTAGTVLRPFHLAARTRGILLPHGNPRSIRGVEDLAGLRVCAVAGSREGTGRAAPGGWDAAPGCGVVLRDAPSDAAVAAAVRSGLADAGLGTEAAARALALDFLPLGVEDVALVLRADFAASPAGEALLRVLRSDTLRAALAGLGGHDAARSGEEADSLPAGA
jgi:putative molybdopterin biosynthesis protein